MEFRILGPLEVREGNRLLPLGGAKQRALLALLLLHANEVVSKDRLIDELWGERPPETVATMLQVYVSRLRKVLEPKPVRRQSGQVLVTRANGYEIRLAPDDLDAWRFERLAGEAKDQLVEKDAARASATLRDALALWRGPALADFAYETFARAAIARLAELRVTALEDRIDADLTLGRHFELVGELQELITKQPSRERLRGQLMVALYRSGRQGEALEVFQQTRRVLIDELGIEPSPSLQQLERAILNQDPTLEFSELAPVEHGDTMPIALGVEERKVVTVLVAGLVDSTGLAGSRDPERARAFLERFREAMTDEIEVGGGTVETVLGEAVMAAFGAPTAREDHAERALHTALAMQRRLAALCGDEAGLRIGVDSGEAVVSTLPGSSSLVTGLAVNVASRLEHAAKPGEILVGERTAETVRGAFEFGAQATLDGKGSGEDLACRRLLRALSFTRPRGVGALRQVFVGRESELELLRATYERTVRAGESHLVTIVGDAGVGKSRLVRELWEWLGSAPSDPLRRAGRCLPYGRGITYWPLGEVLKEQLGLLESDPPATVRRRLGARPILGLTLGLDLDEELHPLSARERLYEAWVELFEELIRERPGVLLIEDLHWGEEPLLDLIERLVRGVQGPLMILATARPELLDVRPSWSGGRGNAATIWLEPLSAADTGRMVDQLLTGELPERLRGLVLERAEGNPFFVEELLAALIDQGMLMHPEGIGVADDLPSEVSVPASVQAALAARIDLLPPTEKSALQAASVIGRTFWTSPVRELLDGAEPDFALLEERGFVRRRPGSSIAGEREYAIRHALTRDVAYSSLPASRRARLHAGFAGWLELVGEGRDEHAPFLAHHYAQAVRPSDADLAWHDDEDEFGRLCESAIAWLRRSAHLAVSRYAIDEALALLQRALELERSESGQAELWRAIGWASALKYDGEAFWDAMERAIALTQDAQAAAELYSQLALETAGRPGMWRRSPDRARVAGWIDEALARSEAGSDAWARALVARALADPLAGAADAREGLRVAEREGDDDLAWRAWRVHVEAALREERYDEALALVADQFGALKDSVNPDFQDGFYWFAALANLGSGRIEEGRQQARLMSEIDDRLTPHHAVHSIGVRLMLEELTGRWGAACLLIPETQLRVDANASTPCAINARSLLVCALACAHAGDESEAQRLEETADELDMEGYGITLDAPRIRLALLRGNLETVERLLAAPAASMIFFHLATVATRLDGLAALRDHRRVEEEAPPLLQPHTYLEPFARRALGIVQEDPDLLARAATDFDALGLDWHAAETRSLLG